MNREARSTLDVVCGGKITGLTSGRCSTSDMLIECQCANCKRTPGGRRMTPQQWQFHCGNGSNKNWLKSIRLAGQSGQDATLKSWMFDMKMPTPKCECPSVLMAVPMQNRSVSAHECIPMQIELRQIKKPTPTR